MRGDMNNVENTADSGASQLEVDAAVPVAWQMIELGRYQPMRIRGSCLGRELG
jgi:hypothetical protein